MSDVSGIASRKIKGEKDPRVRFYFLAMVSRLCYDRQLQLSSYTIMRFLEKAPTPRDIRAELSRLRKVYKDDNNVLKRYVKSILEE